MKQSEFSVKIEFAVKQSEFAVRASEIAVKQIDPCLRQQKIFWFYFTRAMVLEMIYR